MAGKLSYRKTGAKAFSHSRLEALDSCARKFEIEGKLNLKKHADNVTFAYGHGFGEGVQALLSGKTYEEAVWAVFANWEVPIDMQGTTSDIANNKTFWDCIEFIRIFAEHMEVENEGYLNNDRKIYWDEWELAKIRTSSGEIKDAIELEIFVDLGNDFYYEGHIDIVLKHKYKDYFAILELKTSALTSVDASIFGNSPQPTGYMMVLDTFLVKDDPDATTSFDVFYLVGSPKDKTFYEFQFTKTPLHRTQWLSYIMGKMDQISYLEQSGLPYPINFKSCFSYMRRCSHYGTCHLPNDKLQLGFKDTAYADNPTPPDIAVTLLDIVERQQYLIEKFEVISYAGEGEIYLNFDDLPNEVSYGKSKASHYLDDVLDAIRFE